MAHYVDGGSRGFIAGADLPLGTIVKLSGQSVVAATAGTDLSVGVIAETVKSGRTANVRLRSAAGTVNVVAGGTIAVGDALTATAAGAAIATTTAGNQIVAYAIEAGVAGQIIEALPTTAKY